MQRLSYRVVFLTAVGFVASHAAAGETDAEKPRLLEGMRRTEVVAFLGEPDKSKWADGKETLVYKLRRVGDDHVPAANERTVDLPGIGRCVHRVPWPIEGYREELTFEPTHINEDGEMVGGGVSHTQSRTLTLDDGEFPPDPQRRDGNYPKGKVRLLLTLGWDGKVAEWTTKGGK